MVDVSYDFIKELQDSARMRSWKLPSGCMIQDMSNGKSNVSSISLCWAKCQLLLSDFLNHKDDYVPHLFYTYLILRR